MMVVEFAPGSPPRLGRPRALFAFDSSGLFLAAGEVRNYDVAPDGQRFYAVQCRTAPPFVAGHPHQLLVNWLEELKAKVPVR